MTTNVYRLQWQQTIERMRGLFVLIIIVQLLFTLLFKQYTTYNLITYELPSTIFIIAITLMTILFGAFKLGAVEAHDVFRLPPSVKWRVDSVMLVVICLYGSVTSLLVGYMKFLFIKDDALYIDRTLINGLYFYTNILVCFLLMLAVALFVYTIRLCIEYQIIIVAIGYIAVLFIGIYVAFDQIIQTIPSTSQWLILLVVCLIVEWLFLSWCYKGGKRA